MFGIGQDLSKIPNNVLQQAVLGSVPTIQPASALGELNSRIKQAQMSQMAMGQQAMGQNAAMGGQPPIAAQVMQQAQSLNRGIGALPEAQSMNYAGGGVVAFENGGPTFGYAPEYEQARKYGIVLSPYDPPEVRQKKLEEVRKLAEYEAQPKGDIPNEFAIRNMIAGYTDPNRARLDAPTPPTAQAAPGAATQSAVQRPPAPPRAQAAPAAPAPDEFMKQIAALRANEENLAKQAGTLSPELIQAREEERGMRSEASKARKAIEDRRLADIAKQEAEAEKQRGMSPLDNPALLAAIAGGARGRRLGDVLSGAAGAGGTEYTRQQKEMRDIQDKIRADRAGVDTLTLARMDYDAATQQMKVAELTGDRDRMIAAQTKLAEAQRHLLDTQQRYEYGKEHLATNVKIANIQAAAKATAADLAERKLALQSMKSDPTYKSVQDEMKAATAQLAQLGTVIDPNKLPPALKARLDAAKAAVVALARKHGASPEDVLGVSSDTSGASPGAGQRVVDFSSIK